jgi:glutamyl-tRNA synthetase
MKNYPNFINESVNGSVRVRFAPSPTGALHIGGVRTALYNYLFAKQNNGKLILRIEDTDSTRFVPGAEKYIQDSFDWLGIEFDESPSKGGNFGPYKQSERKDIYQKYVQQLIDEGKAYYSFDTTEDLDKARADIPNFSYDSTTRNSMINSLTLPKEEVDKLLKERNDWVVRIKYPDTPVDITVNDMIRGNVSMNTGTLDDKVIWKKKDELPTYHLANIVDDHLMEITHVIRGEEWLPSAPLHIYLYDCFGWDAPDFAHLPLILGPKGKLSKRDGDKFGFPVFPLKWTDPKTGDVSSGYKSDGYTPDAVINLLAFLGWNPGTNKEIYSMDELIQDFDIKRVGKSGAKFNPDKAAWFNGQHLRNLSTDELADEFKKDLDSRGIKKDDNFINRVIDENKSKVNFIKDLYNVVNYLFEKPTDFDKKATKKWNDNTSPQVINGFVDSVSTVDKWEEKEIQFVFEKYVEDSNIKFGQIASLLRVLLTGKSNGPSMFGIMELLGKEESLERLSNLGIFTNTLTDTVETDGIDNNTKEKIIQTEKELDTIKKLITSSEKKLNNKNFLERAPENVVQKEKEKIIEFKDRISFLTIELKKLQ